MLPSIEKQRQIVDTVRRRVYDYHWSLVAPPGETKGPVEKYCLFWAYFTTKVLNEELPSLQAQIQAGTAYWPIVKETDPDDGVSPNQYGFRFQLDGTAIESLSRGLLPEMHVWVAVAKPPIQIIDVTAPFFRRRAIQEGYTVTGEEPPDYFWWEGVDLPWGVTYQADARAIQVCYQFLRNCGLRR